MSKKPDDLSEEQQRALDEFQKIWADLSPAERKDRRKSLADTIVAGLPHTSEALRRDASDKEVEEAVLRDRWEEKRKQIILIQEQAALILNLLLEKDEIISFVNMGEVWKPSQLDFQRAFIDGAEEAWVRYQKIWDRTPVPLPKEGLNQLLIQASTPDLLPEARLFPKGYGQCVHRFHPKTVWVSWKYLRQGETSGMAYNGLAWLGDRFKWFPKPWRLWDN